MQLRSQAFKKSADSNRYNIGSKKIPKNYDPLKDDGQYMNPTMLAYFWQKLRNEYSDLEKQIRTLEQDIRTPHKAPDKGDESISRSTTNANISRANALRSQRISIGFIIEEIEMKGAESEYGYCRNTGEEIGVERLMAVPWTMLSVESQQAQERAKSLHADGIVLRS